MLNNIRRERRAGVVFALVAAAAVAAAMLVSSGAYERPETFDDPSELDRDDCRVGVLAGYDSERVSRQVFPHAQLVGFSEFEDAFTALLGGRIEGFVYNEHVLNTALRTYPNRLKVLDRAIAKDPSVVLVSPGRAGMLPSLNRFIDNYRRAGVYDDMFTRWCQSDEYVPMPEIPEDDGSKGVLRIGTSGTEEPSSFYDDSGTLTGFDIEFARRFARFMHLKPEFVAIPDDEILGELVAGRVDVVIDDYNVNEAPKDARISKGYFDSDTKVLVRAAGAGGMMLGSKRLGFSGRLIKDPRVALLLRGFLNTASLTVLSAMFGFLIAWGLRRLETVGPLPLKYAIAYLTELVRWLPPPVVMLVVGCLVFSTSAHWFTAVLGFSVWFASVMEPVAAAGPRAWLPSAEKRLIQLLQWTSVAGSVSVCDLAMAADLVCGRSLAAFGPLVSVAAAYCVLSWLIIIACRKIERALV